ncbi:MAG: ABC transporter permease [Lachnospiraceae bacterium]|nr:ABC transporter permease [Lachnospiraceae bacterium]
MTEQKKTKKNLFVFANRPEPAAGGPLPGKAASYAGDALRQLRKDAAAVAAVAILAVLVLMAVFAPDFNEYSYRRQLLAEDYVNMPPRIRGLTWIPLFNGHATLKERQLSSLSDTAKYPEGCVIRTFNERTVRGIPVADVEVDYYLYKGAGEDVNFWFGTDALGRDIWTRTWRGTRVSLLIAFAAVLLDLMIGTVWGAVCGWYGGKTDLILMRICEVVRAIPNVVICTLMIMLMGSGVGTMILALACRNWVGTAQLVRAQFLRFKGREYVLAAQTMGASDVRIMSRHILPNAAGPIINRAVMAVPGVIFTEAFLSYIGLGIAAPEPSLGNLLAEAQGVLGLYPTQTLFPALIISLMMIAFHLLSNGLRDALDTKTY